MLEYALYFCSGCLIGLGIVVVYIGIRESRRFNNRMNEWYESEDK